RHEPERPLLFEIVNLDDDAIDLVVERFSMLVPVVVESENLFGRAAPLRVRLDRKSVGLQPLEQRVLSVGQGNARDGSRAMRDEAKRARCRDGRIELAHAPRRRIPRIRIRLLAGGRRALVQGSEFTLLKEDLTTDFQTLGDTQPLRFPHWNGEGDGGNRFDVLRDVLALDAVPPGGANG